MWYGLLRQQLDIVVIYCYRMKEQLIKELVKTGKDAEQMNKQYAEKVHALEKVTKYTAS